MINIIVSWANSICPCIQFSAALSSYLSSNLVSHFFVFFCSCTFLTSYILPALSFLPYSSFVFLMWKYCHCNLLLMSKIAIYCWWYNCITNGYWIKSATYLARVCLEQLIQIVWLYDKFLLFFLILSNLYVSSVHSNYIIYKIVAIILLANWIWWKWQNGTNQTWQSHRGLFHNHLISPSFSWWSLMKDELIISTIPPTPTAHG